MTVTPVRPSLPTRHQADGTLGDDTGTGGRTATVQPDGRGAPPAQVGPAGTPPPAPSSEQSAVPDAPTAPSGHPAPGSTAFGPTAPGSTAFGSSAPGSTASGSTAPGSPKAPGASPAPPGCRTAPGSATPEDPTGGDIARTFSPATRIEAALCVYLDRRCAELAERAVDPGEVDVARTLTRFVLSGGKRLRPLFGWWAWRAAGGPTRGPLADVAIRAVAALELVQACALVHDDLMDDSRVRRGAAAVHIRHAERHRRAGWAGDPARHGRSVALLVGDLALAWADDMLAAAGIPADTWSRVREPWQAMRTEALTGQYLDLLTHARRDGGERAALRVNRLKSAAYTVERPLQIGALLAGADRDTVAALRGFGADLGTAFQLRDDLLGVFGDPDITGKPRGDDLRDGKRTLLMAVALRRATESGRTDAERLLRAALGEGTYGVASAAGVDPDAVRRVLRELGAVDEVEERIAGLTRSALARLATVPLDPAGATHLAELAARATRRDH
ncbi:polyprenyl synthetase family protein [Allostreptomyces psammosilenae]|uniref:Geranylgeranyl diphosphate synthase type I n=1 Tax=Allostreptomyces psammosilenae TaxID=1892865 RepID=A0A852ZRW0_9ACTN|nr:polyprenyl synthetase family protein [Allostreptomyces psammosilenae]NYI03594.1 geranylgeranyl diphosphate synthase type I [Allostreptomyces psammosilenae]